MQYFDERKISDFSKNIKNVFNLLTITGKYKIIGSASLKSILYSSDYDLMEYVKKGDNLATLGFLYKIFLQKFKDAKKDKNIFITDFKCGEINDEPIRWDYKTMIKGSQMIGDKEYTFQECLLMKSTIKLDAIVLINGIFTEFSENYYLKLGDITNYNKEDISEKGIKKSIEGNIKELEKEGNYYKMLKRIFAYKLFDKVNNQKKLIYLIDYFNSYIGIINKCRAECDILILVLECVNKRPLMKDIFFNLQIVGEALKTIKEIDLSNLINFIDKIHLLKNKNIIKMQINIISQFLLKITNDDAKKKMDLI